MSDNINLSLTIEAWAEIVIKTWLEKIIRLNINYSHALYNSFAHHVITNANGDPERIEFAFLYYGKFVDMGVGNGVSKSEATELVAAGMNGRHAKPWYSKTFYHQLQVLRELLAEKYAMKASQVIMINLESFDAEGEKIISSKSAQQRENKSSQSAGSNTNPTAKAYDKARGRGY
ncbi:MAG TPA: hypothetical protein DCR40_10260 [Prolixibacteraceae bacterium]|nr:hypothetical protein [Prolixibacteraceae bacterium]